MSVQSRKVKMVLNFLENKPERYKIVPVTMPAVQFEQLVDECSVSCGVNTNQTKAVIDALINRLVHYMEVGLPVSVGEFGSFKPTFRSKTTKNPDNLTMETITKKVLRFYPGKAFRQMLSTLKIAKNDTLNSGINTEPAAGGE